MARGGGSSNSSGNGAGLIGTMMGGNVLGGGSMNAGGGMVFVAECGKDSSSLFCKAMKFFAFAQGAIYVLCAMLFFYFIVMFLLNGGFSKIGSMARDAGAVSPLRRSAPLPRSRPRRS